MYTKNEVSFVFFDIFCALCDKKGVSVTKATVEIGLSRTIGTKWKKTDATPNGETLNKIANYFGVSTDYLLGYTPQAQLDAINTKLRTLGAKLDFAENDAQREEAETEIATLKQEKSRLQEEILKKEKVPTIEGERSVSDEDVMFALWGDTSDITEADLADVKRYAAFLRERKRKDG